MRRLGNEASGIVEMAVRGGLTVDESNTIAEILSDQPSEMVAGAKLADAIAAEEEISITEAFQIIENTIAGRTSEPAADAIRLKHASRIQEIHNHYERSNRLVTVATVTALIRHRLDRLTWSVADTGTLHRQLLRDIWDLALDEQQAESAPAAPPSEEDLKKQPPASSPRTKRTGTKSSGT
jgi:hypothetical protein